MTRKEIKLALKNINSAEEITPAIACEMLLHNTMNRAISSDTVSAYAESMKDGYWACNGEAIIFSNKGTLLDGQQRLSAVVKSGISIASVIIRGVNKKDFDSMGQGRKRTNGTILAIENYKNANLCASTVRGLYIYNEFGVMARNTQVFGARKMKEAMEDLTFLVESVDYASSFKRPLFTKTIIGMLHNTFCNLNYAMGEQFMDAILTGNVGDEMELLKVRNYFIDLKMQGHDLGHKREFVCGVLIKSWNAWRTNRVMPAMEYKRGESFPVAV